MSVTIAARIAIIGAGPSGLAQLRAFENARLSGVPIPEMVCFEKQSDWGGLWNYTWRTGLDENGEPVHGSMYRHLWSNGPKECLEFADYSFEEHFGHPIPSYPPRAVLLDYITGRAQKSDVRKYIRFNTPVKWITYSESTEKFTVTVNDFKNDELRSESFDYVIVASGHFSTPNVPDFPGLDTFSGRVLHAHDFRDATEFEGKKVLIVGGSYSAEDIGSQCCKYGATSITFSYRTRGLEFSWPETFKVVPFLTRIEGKTVFCVDGTSIEVDAIVLCTGYKHHFPFLPDDLRLRTRNLLYPLDLYKGIFWIKNPKLAYLGMQDQYYTYTMFDAQAYYARDVILGRLHLPGPATFASDIKAWQIRQEGLQNPFEEIDFQTDYVRDLIFATDCPELQVEKVAELFKQWERDKKVGILEYRDKSFPSVITGNLAPLHHAPWMKVLDDSLEAFLSHHRAKKPQAPAQACP